MFCHQCGATIADEAKFCSGCGRTVEATDVAAKQQRSMSTHVSVLAWLFIGCAILYGMAALALFIAPKILQQLPIPNDIPVDVVGLVASLSGIIGTAILLVAAGTAAVGVGLLQYQSWGRPLALVMSAFNLLNLPFGTALGIYGFWVLLSERGRAHYDHQSAIAEGRVPSRA